jgi:hypothetical protein
MPGVLWFGFGFPAVGLLFGAVGGARSKGTSFRAGVLTGLFLGFLAGFPFLAIGLSTS